MANSSIYAVFERMWQHSISNFASTTDVSDLQELVGNIPISEQISTAIDNVVYVSEENQESAVVPLNADTLGGIPAVQYAKMSNTVHRNLLDNSDFTNPVNQRGKTSYSEKGYHLDRWLSNNTRATVTIKDDCINLKATTAGSGFMRQTLPKDLNGIYTLAICVRGTGQGQIYTSRDTNANAKRDFTATSDWSVVTFVFNTEDAQYVPNQFSIAVLAGENYDIKWAALYEGEYTTETLPEYQPKGYAAELAECQRYYYRIKASWKWIAMGICISETQAMFTFKLPQPMRVIPTITIPDPSLIFVRCGNNSTQNPTAFGWEYSSDLYDIFQMEATVSGAGRGVVAGLYFDDEGIIEFSADFPGGL